MEEYKARKTIPIDPHTGYVQKDLIRDRSCPVCGSSGHREVFVKKGFPHVICDSCGMFYVNRILREDILNKFYTDEKSWNNILLTELQLDLDGKKFAYGLDLIEELCGEPGPVLDVGCGPGIFLEAARERGWKVSGIEFNEGCCERLSSLSIECFRHPIPSEENGLKDDYFQAVTAWDVLEHIAEPNLFLSHINQKMRPGGILLILVPNINGLALRLLREKSITFAGEAHLNFFNLDTLTRLLEHTGFKVEHGETLLTEIGSINNYLNYEDPYSGPGETVMDFLTPELIHKNMLGSRLLVLSRKVSPTSK